MVWLAGVTGYWLIWDVRAFVITDYFRTLLDSLTGLGPNLLVVLTTAGERGSSWAFFLVILAAHVILFLAIVGFFVLHIRRLKRPKWLPPVHWVAAVTGVLLVLSALFPVGMLPQASLDRLPSTFDIDPLFLFYFPFGRAWWAWLLLGVAFLAVAALPWLSRARQGGSSAQKTVGAEAGRANVARSMPVSPLPPPVSIIKERCTGCTKCALDCPYGAIEMVDRHDGRPHKYIAIEDTSLCVSCGICVGSCDGVAVTLGSAMPENLWQLVEQQPGLRPEASPAPTVGTNEFPVPAGIAGATVVYTCDRHARHGARTYVQSNGGAQSPSTDPVVIVLPCVGALPPDLTVRTLKAGAAEVRVIGCPPDDCTNREGNLWTSQRLSRERLPRLKKAYADAPIAAFWMAPDDFERGLSATIPVAEDGGLDYAATRELPTGISWRNLVPAVMILGAVLLAQILLNDIPFTPYSNPPATIQMVIENAAAPFGMLAPEESSDTLYTMEISVDGTVVTSQSIAAADLLSAELDGSSPRLIETTTAPGEHQVTIRIVGNESGSSYSLFDDIVTIAAGQVLRPRLNLGYVSDCPAGVIDNQRIQCER